MGGGGGFNYQTGPILVHIHPLFNNNLHVKYRSNLIRTFGVQIKFLFVCRVMLGPYIKSRGTRGSKMSANADLITVETCVQGETFENQLYIFWAIWGALRGSSIIRISLSCFPAILSPISMYMSNKEAI